jgi:hypothetical protein
MCPDPFDYSGPVPNGSSPQNDFRARSNGIRPLLAAPRPWPPVVENDAGTAPVGPGDGPTSSVVVAAAAETEESRVVPVVREALEQPAAEDTDAGASLGEPALEPVPETEGEVPAESDSGESIGAAAAEAAAPPSPAIRREPPWGDAPRAETIPVPVMPEDAPALPATPPAPRQGLTASETPGWRPRR